MPGPKWLLVPEPKGLSSVKPCLRVDPAHLFKEMGKRESSSGVGGGG